MILLLTSAKCAWALAKIDMIRIPCVYLSLFNGANDGSALKDKTASMTSWSRPYDG